MTISTGPLDYLQQQLPVLDTTRGLLRAATAIAIHDEPDLDPLDVERQIEQITADIEQRFRADSPSLQAILAHAHAVLFEEMGFLGDIEDYDNPVNSYLPRVLKRRRGMPITLTLVYKAVLEPLGVAVVGINAPMHFFAGVEDDTAGDLMYVDPFVGGKVLTAGEVFDRLEKATSQPIERDPGLLQPATHAQWLLRILRNLIAAFERRNDPQSLAVMAQMYTLVEEKSRDF
jgi:regulator of sirC expression with transglutaminase-like and TPR domain